MAKIYDETRRGPVLLTERAAAGYLGLTLDDLRHEVNQGRIHKHTSRHFRESDLDEWRRNLPRMLAGRMPDMDFAGVPHTQRAIERARRSGAV